MKPTSKIMLPSGSAMPVIGLGTWQLSEKPVEALLRAFELGYRLIDTSGDYGTQEHVGKACRKSGLARKDIYVVTKIEETEDAYEASRKNLEELGLEYADLILIHRPPSADNPGVDLWQGLIKARDEGLTRDIGVSNYSIRLMRALTDATGETPAVNQLEWSPFGHSEDMYGYCLDNGVLIQAYSPLTRTRQLENDVLAEIANSYHKTPVQVILRWNLQMDTVPLPKATSSRHLMENIDIFDFELSDDDMATLNGLNERYSALSGLPYE